MAYYNGSGISAYSVVDYGTIYEGLINGKPTMFELGHNLSGGQHWVVITGRHEGVARDNLTYKDFIAIDPGTGTKRTMENIEKSYSGFYVKGAKYFS